MSIYQSVLGEEFQNLHPMLRARYSIPIGKPFRAAGTMHKIETGAAWLKPLLKLSTHWRFLFPESGKDVPFTITNTRRLHETGEDEIYWERTFDFGKVNRHFNALMTIDPKRKVVRDYLGEPSLFYSDLKFAVTSNGCMHIRSGTQRIVLGRMEIPIHRMLGGDVTVVEGYDDSRDVFTIRVDIRNRIVGRLVAYEGEFKALSL